MRKNAKDPSPNPGSVFQMSHSFHLSHLSQAFQMSQSFQMSQMSQMFAVFSRTRDAHKKQNTKKCGIRKLEVGMSCQRPARQPGLIFEFGIWNLELLTAYFLKSKTMLANAFTPTSSRLSSMMKSGVWCGAASFGSLPAGIPPTVK